MQISKVGLDIDGVICNFVQGVLDIAHSKGLENFPQSWEDVDNWHICEGFFDVMQEVSHDKEFWLKLKPLPYSLPLDFTPDCYVTARPIESWVTEQWLSVNRFPKADVITVAKPEEKLEKIVERKLDLFVDDHFKTIPHLLENGINAYLYYAPYQRGHEVSHLPTIKHLSEVKSIGTWRVSAGSADEKR